MGCKLINIAIVLIILVNKSIARLSLDDNDLRRPFDQELYQNVLDPEACTTQLRNITENPLLLLQFLDAGIRFPRGFLEQNLMDMGNYYQCLGINEAMDIDQRIQGKYCMIQVPSGQDTPFSQFSGNWLPKNYFHMDEVMKQKIEYVHSRVNQVRAAQGFEDFRSGNRSIIGLPSIEFRLAVCIPKPCTPQDVLSNLAVNVTELGVTVSEEFCRLPNDKPWVAADTVAVVVFSLIGFLTLMSTCYDLYHTVLMKSDPKLANTICTSFSVYTNTHNLLTFNTSKGALECLDGIRVLAMMWVIVGHTFMMYPFTANVIELFEWFISPEALWITTAPITVDTFFMLAGVLLVYTSVGKMNGKQLLSRLHIFYLNRLLRMFPALAAIVLLEASVFHRMADGPVWTTVARNAQRCRSHWWATLLHVQNYVTPNAMCIPHSWYVAIDIQLYIISPLILFWVLNGNKRSAWIALVTGLLAIMTGATIFNFIMKLPGGSIAMGRWTELEDFMKHYYFNTLTRGAPFFVGMIFGYILHLCRGIKVKIHLALVLVFWLVSLALFALPFYTTYLIVQWDWDNQTVDSLINSFQRALWAVGLGWLIFACVHGYGGPINWLLSRPLWKLPSKLSYAMYLYHYSLMFVFGDRSLAPNYFSVPNSMYDFISQFSLVILVALVVAIVIEAPFSTLFKLMLDRGKVTTKPKIQENNVTQKNEAMS